MAKTQVAIRLDQTLLDELETLAARLVPNLVLDRTQMIELAVKGLLDKHRADDEERSKKKGK